MSELAYEVKSLPFDKDMGLPQRLRFKHKNELYRLTYRRNSFDKKIHIIIELVKTGELLLTARVVEGGKHLVTKSEDKGMPVFMLYVDRIGADVIDISIIDNEMKIKEVG